MPLQRWWSWPSVFALLLREEHGHAHEHNAMSHEHMHTHDEHNQHSHPDQVAFAPGQPIATPTITSHCATSIAMRRMCIIGTSTDDSLAAAICARTTPTAGSPASIVWLRQVFECQQSQCVCHHQQRRTFVEHHRDADASETEDCSRNQQPNHPKAGPKILLNDATRCTTDRYRKR